MYVQFIRGLFVICVYEKCVRVCTCLCFDIREVKTDFNGVGFATLICSVSKRVKRWICCRVLVGVRSLLLLALSRLVLSLLSSTLIFLSCLSCVGNDI